MAWINVPTEFPDYPMVDLPAMPAGFVDVSWHNDTCPSACNADARLMVFVDYVDAGLREFPENEGRFTLARTDEGGAVMEGLASTDDWQTILDLIAVA